MDSDLYDEFGNYIGPELESEEEEEIEEPQPENDEDENEEVIWKQNFHFHPKLVKLPYFSTKFA